MALFYKNVLKIQVLGDQEADDRGGGDQQGGGDGPTEPDGRPDPAQGLDQEPTPGPPDGETVGH